MNSSGALFSYTFHIRVLRVGGHVERIRSSKNLGYLARKAENCRQRRQNHGIVMHVAERIQDDTLVLMISGRVTFYSRKVFQAIVSNARLSGAKHIMFNIQGVTFMDSTALGGLALAYLNLKECDVAMSLVGPQQPIKTLLDAINFSTLIPTYPSEKLAFQSIQ